MGKHFYQNAVCTSLVLSGLCIAPMLSAADPVENKVNATEKTVNRLPQQPQKDRPLQPLQPSGKTELPSVTPKRELSVAAPVKTVELQVPCLTVHEDETHGKISYIPLRFTRTNENKPLRVMITDDTPGGSGQTIHSSVWLAAVTAAMLRNDTMHGTTISVEFSGLVDGPSAGGVTCLAILSAMDGRPLPKDFAMTGTILPDGTIGVVGGVPEKMRAAAKAGVKRIFIPAFLRIFKNAKGEDVDLTRLAEELKVELHRVENIAEAYAILHNLPYQENGYVNVRKMTQLPRQIEDVLLPVYKDLYKKVYEKIKAKPDLKDTGIGDAYVLSPELAQDYYSEGKLLPATLQIFRSYQAWLAYEKNNVYTDAFYKEKSPEWNRIKYLREYHSRNLLYVYRDALKKYTDELAKQAEQTHQASIKKNYPKDADKMLGYFPNRPGLGVITAQLEPVALFPTLWGNLEWLAHRRSPKEVVEQASLKELEEYWNDELYILSLYHLIFMDDTSLTDFLTKLGDALPELQPNKYAADVERLFYAASCSADSVAGQNFNNFAEMAEGQRKNAAAHEFRTNPFISVTLSMSQQAQYAHSLLEPDSEKKPFSPEYHLHASLKNQVYAFAMSSALLVMYGPDQGNDFIPHLWRNARGAAIKNINDCVKAGIPCLAAICDFEMAEAARDSNQTPIEALTAYWRSSLYAKALLMSFDKK